MTLVLRKCWKDGSSRNGFEYGQVGERVYAPDWRPNPYCGNGLHGLKEGNGDWGLLEGDDWLIIDADDQIVDIDEYKCKFNTGVILFRGTQKQLANSEFPKKLKLNEEPAYEWALYIGNKNIMSKKIRSEEYAYLWARDVRTNKNLMINKIKSDEYAYKWAKYIGDRDVMIKKIKSEEYAYIWAHDIGNRDIMINRITSSEYAYYWAKNIGNHDVMKSKITKKNWIETWNFYFPNNKIERS